MASNHSSSDDNRSASPDSSEARRQDVPEGFGFIARDQDIEDIDEEAQPLREDPVQPAAIDVHHQAAQDIEGLFYGSHFASFLRTLSRAEITRAIAEATIFLANGYSIEAQVEAGVEVME